MEELLSSITNTASTELGEFDFIFNSALGGAATLLVLFLLIRFLARALIYSWFGKQGGAIVSTLIEATVVVFMVASAWRNPGILIAGLTWGAIIFKSVIQGF